FAVAKDRGEMIRRTAGHRNRFRKEDRAFAGVAVGKVDEMPGGELLVVKGGAFQAGEPVGPRRAHEERLEAPVARGVGRDNRKKNEGPASVGPVALRLKRGEGRSESRLAKAILDPCGKVLRQGREVFRLMRKLRAQRFKFLERGWHDTAGL